MYSVYRLDHISEYGELVRSVNLSDKTFNITTEPFPYQKNGIYMCVVSNGVPDTDGKFLQSWSTRVKYEGRTNILKFKYLYRYHYITNMKTVLKL